MNNDQRQRFERWYDAEYMEGRNPKQVARMAWEAALSQPDMVLVPREPTKKMIDAATMLYFEHQDTKHSDVYRAMIEAQEGKE